MSFVLWSECHIVMWPSPIGGRGEYRYECICYLLGFWRGSWHKDFVLCYLFWLFSLVLSIRFTVRFCNIISNVGGVILGIATVPSRSNH